MSRYTTVPRMLSAATAASLFALAASFAPSLAAEEAANPANAPADKKEFAVKEPLKAEWPCIARKVVHIDAATIWDGPAIDEKDNSWFGDEAIRKLSQFLLSRRIPEAEVEAAVKKFAEGVPEAERDKKLALLFTAALKRSNDERKLVMQGIEKFHKRQVELSKTIEAHGAELPDLDAEMQAAVLEAAREGDIAGPVGKVSDAIAAEQAKAKENDKNDPAERLKWEIRVFQERQQNIPVACEIPGLLEERIGLVARAIRAEMSN